MVIVFEGIDGSGKSSQARALARHLRAVGYEVDEPTRNRDRRLRKVYRGLIATTEAEAFPAPLTSLLLGLSDYADAAIASAAHASEIRVFDRYCCSALADGIALGLDPDDVVPLARLFPAPDLTLLVDLPAAEALERKGSCTVAEAGGPDPAAEHDSLEAGFVAYQERVRRAYRTLADAGALANLVVVDGSRDFEAVETNVRELVAARLSRRQRARVPA